MEIVFIILKTEWETGQKRHFSGVQRQLDKERKGKDKPKSYH